MSKKSALKTSDEKNEQKKIKTKSKTETKPKSNKGKNTKLKLESKSKSKIDSEIESNPVFEVKEPKLESNLSKTEDTTEIKKPKKRGRKPKETNLISNGKSKITNLHMENEDVIVKLKIRPEILNKISVTSTQLHYNPNIINKNPEPSQESSVSEFAQFKYELGENKNTNNSTEQMVSKLGQKKLDEAEHIDLKQAITERNREARSWFGTRQKEQVSYDIPMPDPGQYIFDSSSVDPSMQQITNDEQEITTQNIDIETSRNLNPRNNTHNNDNSQFFGNVLPCGSKNMLKKVHNIHCEFTEAGKRKNWPDKTTTACYWDCHQFDTMPVLIPTKYFCKTFYFDISKGCFCGFNCAMAYLIEHGMTEQINLLLYFYNCVFNTFVEQIKPALPRQFLKLFGGTMDINLFRQNSIDLRREYNLIIPPTFVFNVPKLEETVSTRIDPRTYTIPSSRVKNNKGKTKRTVPSIKNIEESDNDNNHSDNGSLDFLVESEPKEESKTKTKFFKQKGKKGTKETSNSQSIAQFMSYFS